MLEKHDGDAPDSVTVQSEGDRVQPQNADLPSSTVEIKSPSLKRRLKVLLVAEQCSPTWSSVPLLSYRLFHEISQLADVTLVTHGRNQLGLEQQPEKAEIIFVFESKFITQYYKILDGIINRGRTIWPLAHTLGYPVYAEFNQGAYRRVKDRVEKGEFDIVHALTPMEPRYPIKLIKACRNVPFLLGPVNGGVPFPKGFREKARAEFAYLNFLRTLGRWLVPGYSETYKKASHILAGSSYTRSMLQDLFNLPDDRIELFYENGIPESFLSEPKQPKPDDIVHLLFVGRLVPYKCADILLDAIHQLDESVRTRLKLTIVGDGSEKAALTAQVQQLGLESQVKFTGWVNQEEIVDYYRRADIFCFPSIREYGGGVVLEAMASGLPCIVANNGGIGEYVTDKTGFRIEPLSREYLLQELANKIQVLVENEALRQEMSVNAIERVCEFTWQHKAQYIVNLYHTLIAQATVP